jgi:hypothetical protein
MFRSNFYTNINTILNERLPLKVAKKYIKLSPIRKKEDQHIGHNRFFKNKKFGRFSINLNFSSVNLSLPIVDTKNFDYHTLSDEETSLYIMLRKITRYLDFSKGLGSNDKKRWIKFSKLKNKISPDQLNEFDKTLDAYNKKKAKKGDLSDKKSNNKNYKIIFSNHPYDIAGMSTDRGWISCMNLSNGTYKGKIKSDIKFGTFIAYLVNSEDKNIEEPYARILIKPYARGIVGHDNDMNDNEDDPHFLEENEYFEMESNIADEIKVDFYNNIFKGDNFYIRGKSHTFEKWYEENKEDIIDLISKSFGYEQQFQRKLFPQTSSGVPTDYSRIQTTPDKEDIEELYEIVFNYIDTGKKATNENLKIAIIKIKDNFFTEYENEFDEYIYDMARETLDIEGYTIIDKTKLTGEGHYNELLSELDTSNIFYKTSEKMYYDKNIDLNYELLETFKKKVKDYINKKQEYDKNIEDGDYSLIPHLYSDNDNTIITIEDGKIV